MSNLNLSIPLFPDLPSEVNSIILKNVIFDQPTIFTSKNIKDCAIKINNIAKINRETSEVFSEKMKDLKRIHELINKYTVYNECYELFGDRFINHHLLDAVFTGWDLPGGKHSIGVYTQETEKDIKDIVRLTPQSLNCNEGQTRLTIKTPPLIVACINEKIPVSIVEFLLKSGANLYATCAGKESASYLVEENYTEMDATRQHAILELLQKYKFEKIWEKARFLFLAQKKDPQSILSEIPPELAQKIFEEYLRLMPQ